MNEIVFEFVQHDIKEQFMKQLHDSYKKYFSTSFNQKHYEDYFLQQLKKKKVREYRVDISLPWEQQPDYEGILEDFNKNFSQKIIFQAVAEKKGLEVIFHIKYVAFSFSASGKTLSFLDKKTGSGFTVLVWSHEVERIYWSYQKRSTALADGQTKINTLYDDILIEKESIISGPFEIIDKMSDKNLGETFVVNVPKEEPKNKTEKEPVIENVPSQLKEKIEKPTAVYQEKIPKVANSILSRSENNTDNLQTKSTNTSEEALSIDFYSVEKIGVKARKLVDLWDYHEDTIKYIGAKQMAFLDAVDNKPLETTFEELTTLQNDFQKILRKLPIKRRLFFKSNQYLVTQAQLEIFEAIDQKFNQIQRENQLLNSLI